MLSLQYILVGLIVGAAVIYGGRLFLQQMKAFDRKRSCGSDCGCNSGGKKLPS